MDMNSVARVNNMRRLRGVILVSGVAMGKLLNGIVGDGRCLFRSVVHGACLRSGRPVSKENVVQELADDLRTKVVNELVKRRAETEWFLEGDFEAYVKHMQRSHVWGGEPELLMSSHVLKVPITVYMRDKKSGSITVVAQYGGEYGKENPVSVLYHAYGHYDLLKSALSGNAN